jgi:hypothetical protein
MNGRQIEVTLSSSIGFKEDPQTIATLSVFYDRVWVPPLRFPMPLLFNDT